ncbi:DUF1684 domain-containing protein [Phaeovulum sp.]|uniref:DUF1684 domain-containing protein n=1 Tax=Phaeovulum sp. TaxID=2934796 RepID=UPI0039E55A18
MPLDPAYETRLANHRAARLAELAADDGWLNLTDRIELRQGQMAVGRAADNEIALSIGPSHLGQLTLTGDAASLLTEAGETLALLPEGERPPRLRVAGMLLEIHSVDGRPALRVRDLSPDRAVPNLRYFPTAPAWCLRAEWRALDAPVTRKAEMVNGAYDATVQTHFARFSHAGVSVDLVPLHVKAGQPMFVFRDQTAGHETYGASRFLYGTDIADGGITLDFNTAFNPPCAFSDLAICPLPPRENILPFRVEAGELKP